MYISHLVTLFLVLGQAQPKLAAAAAAAAPSPFPPVALSIITPAAEKFTSGTSVIVTADVTIIDETLQVSKFMTDFSPFMRVCIMVETIEAGDTFGIDQVVADEVFRQQLCDKLDSPTLKFSNVPYGKHRLAAHLVYRSVEFGGLEMTFYTTGKKATPPKVTNEMR